MSLLAATILGCASRKDPPSLHPPLGSDTELRYAVVFDPDRGELIVTAHFSSGGRLHIHKAGRGYITHLEARTPSGWTQISSDEKLPEEGAEVRYRFLLDEALSDLDGTLGTERLGDVRVLSPTFWLLRPRAARTARFELKVRSPRGYDFASGYSGTGIAPVRALDSPALAVFGPIKVLRMRDLRVAYVPKGYPLPDREILDWAATAVDGVTDYFGGSPAIDGLVMLPPCDQFEGPHHGFALGALGGASVRLHIGRNTTPRDLARDWSLTHELLHLGFANVRGRHAWIEEGLATYVEPLIRVRRGEIGIEQYWADLLKGLPNALDAKGRMGFEPPLLWGDTYWGGALFFLRADVAIRERTQGAKTLDDALLAMHAAGNIRMTMDAEDFLELGDHATGGTELADLYDELSDDEEEFDLGAFFQKLGVSKSETGIHFDDEAPGAGMRKAMLLPAEEPQATTAKSEEE
jgi:hypothetical protein